MSKRVVEVVEMAAAAHMPCLSLLWHKLAKQRHVCLYGPHMHAAHAVAISCPITYPQLGAQVRRLHGRAEAPAGPAGRLFSRPRDCTTGQPGAGQGAGPGPAGPEVRTTFFIKWGASGWLGMRVPKTVGGVGAASRGGSTVQQLGGLEQCD